MQDIDWANITAEQLLDRVPQEESDEWEYKGSKALTIWTENQFKEELGKQVSAFANSHGGYYVLGISNKTPRALENCTGSWLDKLTKDSLVGMASASVEHNLAFVKVHPVKMTSEPNGKIWVIEIPDSPMAPHRAKLLKQYYFRKDGASDEAPHHLVDTLFKRESRAVLTLGEFDCSLWIPEAAPATVAITVEVRVKNVSRQLASPYGVLLNVVAPKAAWLFWEAGESEDSAEVGDGYVVVPQNERMFPQEQQTLRFDVNMMFAHNAPVDFHLVDDLLRKTWFRLTPVSQNSSGETVEFCPYVPPSSRWSIPLAGDLQRHHTK